MFGFLWGETPTLLVFAAELLVPLALASLMPRGLRLLTLAASGVVAFAVVCGLAYLANRGGDFGTGLRAAVLVIVINAFHFVPLWLAGSVLGLSFARRRRGESLRKAY